MIQGDPKDMNQEGIFDNVESLDLNYLQAASLGIAVQRQIKDSERHIEYYEQLRADEIDKHEHLTFELVEEELNIHQQLVVTLRQTMGNLKEVIQMLEPTDIIKPKQ